MRIALMTNNYKPIMGGVPISIERLAKELRAMGHQVTVFAPTYSGMTQPDEEGVFRYAVFLKHFIGGIVLPNPYDRRIEEEFVKNHYDIIHVHHPMLIGRTAVYLSRKYNIPLAFTYHTRYEQYAKCYTKGLVRLGKIMPLYLHTFLKHCSYVFAPTAGMREYLVNTCKVAPEKTGVLPTGIERPNFEADSEEADALRKSVHAEGMPLLLTVSRMAQEKNVEFLLESLALMKEYYKKPFRMLMVGDGPDREALEEKCAKLGLADYVSFTGAVPNEEIAPYFKAADFFLFASKTETQGIVILEAFAGKTPVIAVRASGVEDLVEDGRNGFLTIEEPHVYAAQLTAVLEGAYDRQALAENAGQTAEQYREDTVAMKAIRYYNDIIKDHYSTAGDYAIVDHYSTADHYSIADHYAAAGNYAIADHYAAAGNYAIADHYSIADHVIADNIAADRRGRGRRIWNLKIWIRKAWRCRGYRNGAEVSHFSG